MSEATVSDQGVKVAFDPAGEIKSQTDAKAYGEQLVKDRKQRGLQKDGKD